MITYQRASTGVYNVYSDGKPTKYQLVNALGGANDYIYGIYDKEKSKYHWIGTITTTKQKISYWIRKGR